MSSELLEEAKTSARAGDGSPQRRVRVRIDDHQMTTQYANAFRSNANLDELVLDFGINTISNGQRAASGGSSGDADAGEIRFDVHSRLIMNYGTAKRLAILLGNVVREHETRFGEVRLNAGERNKASANGTNRAE